MRESLRDRAVRFLRVRFGLITIGSVYYSISVVKGRWNAILLASWRLWNEADLKELNQPQARIARMTLCMEDADLLQSEFNPMSDLLTVELSKEQRDEILRGLRYVRSSVMLTPAEPSEKVAEGRNEKLQRIAALSSLLSGQEVVQKATV